MIFERESVTYQSLLTIHLSNLLFDSRLSIQLLHFDETQFEARRIDIRFEIRIQQLLKISCLVLDDRQR